MKEKGNVILLAILTLFLPFAVYYFFTSAWSNPFDNKQEKGNVILLTILTLFLPFAVYYFFTKSWSNPFENNKNKNI